MGESANGSEGIVAVGRRECQRERQATVIHIRPCRQATSVDGRDHVRVPTSVRCGSPLRIRRRGAPRTMTPRQIDLIRASWSAVEPIADTAATLFYDHLFELDPAIR